MVQNILSKSYNNIDVGLIPDQIDFIIREDILKATEEDSTIWTCPDYNRREYIHSFFQYPAMMIPAVQKKLIDIVVAAKPDIQHMIDPFMGSATTLVACMENSLNCYGQDVNPLAILIAKARTGPYYTDAIKSKQAELMAKIREDRSDAIEADFKGLYKWFKPEIAIGLSKIVREIRKENNLIIRRFLWVVLAETVRVSSNDRTSTFKLHIRTKEQIDQRSLSVINIFELHLERCLDDYESHADLLSKNGQLYNGIYKSTVDIRLSDSKSNIYSPTGSGFYDLLVTSPPYGDNKTTVTYGQHSYLPLQWIDLEDIDSNANKDFLKTTSEIDTRALGGKLSDINKEKLNELFKISPSLKATHDFVSETSISKVRKVDAFLLDLSETIDKIFEVMKVNSYQIWTLGNRRVGGIEIPNDQIIRELIESKGGKLVTQLEREIINKRMARRNNNSSLMNTEDILIFRKLG
ncbi:MAG: hypothetical protein ACKVOU_04545 [Cytophagales bacterium]